MRGRAVILLSLSSACGGPPAAPAPPPARVETFEVPPLPTAAPLPPPPTGASLRFGGPPPNADYTSLADVVKAASKSVGKIAQLRVRRDHYTSATQFTAVPCVDRVANASIWLRYTREDRDWVRAMHDTPDDRCANVSFEIVAFRPPPAPLVEGKIVHVADLAPEPAAPSPGADYGSIDDAIIDGEDARGKTIFANVWAYTGDPKELWVSDCRRGDAFVFVIPKTAAEKALAAQLATKASTCGPAHLVLADPSFVSKKGGESLQRPRADVVSVP
jgi:hypothetical protein